MTSRTRAFVDACLIGAAAVFVLIFATLAALGRDRGGRGRRRLASG